VVGPTAKRVGKGSFPALDLQRRLRTKVLKLEIELLGLERDSVSKCLSMIQMVGSYLHLQVVPVNDSMADGSSDTTTVQAGGAYGVNIRLQAISYLSGNSSWSHVNVPGQSV
jgi:hypothetical protein